MFSLGRKIALANAGVMKRFQNASNYDPNGSKTTAGGRAFPFIARKASVEQVIKGSLLVISTDDAPSTPDGFGNADGMVVYGVEARYVDDMLVRFLGLYTALDDAIRDIDVFNEDMRGKVLVSMDGLTHVLTPVPDGSLSDAVQEDIQKKSEDGQAQKRQKTSKEGEIEKTDEEGGGAQQQPDNRKFLLDLDNIRHYVTNKDPKVDIRDYYPILRLADRDRVEVYCGQNLLPFDVKNVKNITEAKYMDLTVMDKTDSWTSVARIASIRETLLMRNDEVLGKFMRFEFDRWSEKGITLPDFLRPEERAMVWPPSKNPTDTGFLEKVTTAFKNFERALSAFFGKPYEGVFDDIISRLEDPLVRKGLKMLSQAYVCHYIHLPLYKVAHDVKTVQKLDGSWRGADVWTLRLKEAFKQLDFPQVHLALADEREFYEVTSNSNAPSVPKVEKKTVDAAPTTPTLSNNKMKKIRQQQRRLQALQAQTNPAAIVTPVSAATTSTTNGSSSTIGGVAQGSTKPKRLCVYDLSFKLKLKNDECKNGSTCSFEHRALGDITKEEAKTACKVAMKSHALREKHDAAIDASTELKD